VTPPPGSMRGRVVGLMGAAVIKIPMHGGSLMTWQRME